jgi:hypothetical protein
LPTSIDQKAILLLNIGSHKPVISVLTSVTPLSGNIQSQKDLGKRELSDTWFISAMLDIQASKVNDLFIMH